MSHALRLYFRMIALQIRAQAQHRVSFWIDFFSTLLVNGTSIISIALVMERIPTIGGWTLPEIAFLYGMSEASFGLMDMIFSGLDPDYFAPNIRQGRLDQFLLRPVGLILHLAGSRFVLRRLGRITQGMIVLWFAIQATQVHWTALKVAYIPIVMFSQVIFMGALFLVGSTITFWTQERVEAVNVLTYGGVEMMNYPITIYPSLLRRFITWVIPFAFLNYYPALYFLDKPDPLGLPVLPPFLAPFAAGLMAASAYAFWQFGLRHYQSTGT